MVPRAPCPLRVRRIIALLRFRCNGAKLARPAGCMKGIAAMKRLLSAIIVGGGLSFSAASVSAQSPLADAHIHYSHDAWDMLPAEEAIKVLRRAGLTKAFVSSSSDEGTQMLYRAAPDLIVPVLRPYRRRGETGTWFRDATVGDMVAKLLARNKYAGIRSERCRPAGAPAHRVAGSAIRNFPACSFGCRGGGSNICPARGGTRAVGPFRICRARRCRRHAGQA